MRDVVRGWLIVVAIAFVAALTDARTTTLPADPAQASIALASALKAGGSVTVTTSAVQDVAFTYVSNLPAGTSLTIDGPGLRAIGDGRLLAIKAAPGFRMRGRLDGNGANVASPARDFGTSAVLYVEGSTEVDVDVSVSDSAFRSVNLSGCSDSTLRVRMDGMAVWGAVLRSCSNSVIARSWASGQRDRASHAFDLHQSRGCAVLDSVADDVLGVAFQATGCDGYSFVGDTARNVAQCALKLDGCKGNGLIDGLDARRIGRWGLATSGSMGPTTGTALFRNVCWRDVNSAYQRDSGPSASEPIQTNAACLFEGVPTIEGLGPSAKRPTIAYAASSD